MISPVSSANQAAQAAGAQKQAPPPSERQQRKPDSVELSEAARAAGDVDHDGDGS